MKKELTICMPVYNGEKYLDESIGSVLNQTYSNFKFLIYDDGSTDGSVEKVKSFNDNRIKLIEGKENHGGIYARTELIKAIDTKYCMWIDQDDRYCRNDAFEYAVKCIKSNDYDIVNFIPICDLWIDGKRTLRKDCVYNDFEYCGDNFFEKFYPIGNKHLMYSKIFKSDIMKKSIPEDWVLEKRFVTDDIFFSAIWYYACKRYLHVKNTEPLYEHKRQIGLWGKSENDFSFERVGKLIIMYYSYFISIFNRMTSIKQMNNKEFLSFLNGSELVYFAGMIKQIRKLKGDDYANKLVNIYHSAFCADDVHLLNGINDFAYPEYVKSINKMME